MLKTREMVYLAPTKGFSQSSSDMAAWINLALF